jgi:hypothetical protein
MDQEEIYNGYYEDTVEVMAELRVTGSIMIEAGRRIPRGLRHAHYCACPVLWQSNSREGYSSLPSTQKYLSA